MENLKGMVIESAINIHHNSTFYLELVRKDENGNIVEKKTVIISPTFDCYDTLDLKINCIGG